MAMIWDVEGIEWEDIPTLGDLLRVADEKTLVREIARCCCEDAHRSERDWKTREKKRARKKRKRILELAYDAVPSDAYILFPKHILRTRSQWAPAGYGIMPACVWKSAVKEISQGSWSYGAPDKQLPYGRDSKQLLGYRVWFGGTWSQQEMYSFLAERCCEILESIDDEDELESYLANGGMSEDEIDSLPFRRVRKDVSYPLEVFNARVYGLDSDAVGLEIPETPYEVGRRTNNGRLNDMVNAMFVDELMDNIAELGKKLERGYER